MKEAIDLTGQKFGRLKVLKKAGGHGDAKWICRCDCGKEVVALGKNLRKGRTRSCGCFKREVTVDFNKRTKATHGMTKTRLFTIWTGIKQRCTNPHAKDYPSYGGRGITVCPEWENFEAFRDWALANGYRDDLTIDRIDNGGDYSPQNCRWITSAAQQNNTRQNRIYTYKGETKTIAEWAREAGMSYGLLYNRLYKGWTIERALTEKIHEERRKK